MRNLLSRAVFSIDALLNYDYYRLIFSQLMNEGEFVPGVREIGKCKAVVENFINLFKE